MLLTHQETVSVDNFFDWILYIRRDWGDTCCSRIDGIRNGARSKRSLDAYNTNAVKHETDLHRPFTELAHSLDKLGGDNIRFCRNDPIIVPGSNGSATASEIGTRDSVDNLSKNRPFENVFHWMELLAFWEFKLVRGKIRGYNARTSEASSLLTRACSRCGTLHLGSNSSPT
jgi:hypothetical protein